METGPVSLTAYARLLRANRDFRLLWLAQLVSEIGDWLYSLAIYDLVLERTASAQAVASAVILQVLPQVLISPVSGVVNDRLSRRRVMIFADLARVAIVLAMLAAVTTRSLWLIYVLLFLETLMWGLFEPGRSALIPNLCAGRGETVVANSLASTTWSFNFMFGFSIGGLLTVALGYQGVFALNAFSFLASAWLLRRMRVTETHSAGRPPLGARDLVDFSPLVEGIRYVRGDARLLAILLCKAGLGFLGASWVILTIYGKSVFPLAWGGVRPQEAGLLGMSVLMGSRGVGAILGPLLAGRWAGADQRRMRQGILVAFLAIAAGYIGLAAAPTLASAMAAIILAHAGGSVIWVFSTTLLQSLAEDRFRGRVFAADYAFLVITMSVMNYLSGAAVDHGIPVQRVAMAVGVIALAPALLWRLAGMPLWRARGAASAPDHADA